MSENLKQQIAKGERPSVERRIYIRLPEESEHKEHVIGEVRAFYILFTIILFRILTA